MLKEAVMRMTMMKMPQFLEKQTQEVRLTRILGVKTEEEEEE